MKSIDGINTSTVEEDYIHDFTDCCISLNVSNKCRGFCNIHSIIDGTAGVEPDVCELDFPRIVKCMADGRNHLPCCERKKIPDVCQVFKLYFKILYLNHYYCTKSQNLSLKKNKSLNKKYIRICAVGNIRRSPTWCDLGSLV